MKVASILLLLAFLANELSQAFQPLAGVRVKQIRSGGTSVENEVDIGQWLSSDNNDGQRCMVVFGTYAADFNAIEYGQRVRYYWPKLQQDENGGVKKCALILNCQPEAALALAEKVDLPNDIDIWVDNTGESGRKFGVSRGWLPDDEEMNPFVKLFGMLFGLGAWATLPAVIGGYLGNPITAQPWIEDALCVGQKQGRWPDNALEIDNSTGNIIENKFESLPVVGAWPRRPLELATLRLQSMIGISLKCWEELAPDQEALDAGVLTQLGGCLIVDSDGETPLYEWRDPEICAVTNFENVLRKLSKSPKAKQAELQTTA